MRKIFLALMMWTGSALAADLDLVDELYIANESGGEIIITTKDCNNPAWVKKGFPNYAYATEGNGTKHEGCWVRPPLQDAPEGAFGIVTSIWENDYKMEYPDYMFRPKNITIKAPPVIVKPTT